jgi:hypothetical protein
MSPGVFLVTVEKAGFARHTIARVELAAFEELDLGVIALSRGGWIKTRDARARPAESRVDILGADMKWIVGCDGGLSPPLVAGRYFLCASGDGVADEMHEVEVADGSTAEVSLAWRRGPPVNLVLTALTESEQHLVLILLTDSQGRRARRRHLLSGGEVQFVSAWWLQPGEYEAKVQVGEQHREARFSVPPDGDAAAAFEVQVGG